MVQVVECQSSSSGPKCRYLIGKGQEIELEMANDVGVKIFQVHQPHNVKVRQTRKWNVFLAEQFRAEHLNTVWDHLKQWLSNKTCDGGGDGVTVIEFEPSIVGK